MEHYVRLWSGVVTLSCEGGYPEQFINDTTRDGFPLWDIKRDGVVLYAACNAADYAKLRPYAHRACVRMRVVKKHGFPFWCKPLRRRGGLWLGGLIFLVILQSLSSRVWVMQVVGNTRTSEQEILQTLSTLGVKQGVEFDTVDIPQIQLEALKQLPQLTWLAVNQTGSTVTVEVRERETANPIEESAPSNILSTHDGVVIKLHVESGQAAVRVGDAVTKNTLLIGGVVDSKVGPLLKRAVGTVTARTRESIVVTVPFTQTVTIPSAKTVEELSFYLLGFRVPLYTPTTFDKPYTVVTKDYPLRVYGKKMPVGFSKQCYVFPKSQTVHRTEEEALQLAKQQLRQKEQEQFSDATIEKAVVTQQKNDNGWQLTANYICVRDIGVAQPINLQIER